MAIVELELSKGLLNNGLLNNGNILEMQTKNNKSSVLRVNLAIVHRVD